MFTRDAREEVALALPTLQMAERAACLCGHVGGVLYGKALVSPKPALGKFPLENEGVGHNGGTAVNCCFIL